MKQYIKNCLATEFKLALVGCLFSFLLLSVVGTLAKFFPSARFGFGFAAIPTAVYFGWWLARNKTTSKWIDPNNSI